MQLLNAFVSHNWHSELVIDMPCLLWDRASGCHGNCISCLGVPQAVSSLAQPNITSHIFCVGARIVGQMSLADMSVWTLNNDQRIWSCWSEASGPLNNLMSNWMCECCSACAFPRLWSLSGGVHVLDEPEVAGMHGGAVPRLKVSWSFWCSRPAGSLLHQDVQPIEDQLGLLLKWSLHSSGKSVFALRPKWAIVFCFATSGLVKALGWTFRGCSVNGLLILCVPP